MYCKQYGKHRPHPTLENALRRVFIENVISYEIARSDANYTYTAQCNGALLY